jgi:hypothetical protein
MGNDERLRGCYVWQARNIKFGSLVKKFQEEPNKVIWDSYDVTCKTEIQRKCVTIKIVCNNIDIIS